MRRGTRWQRLCLDDLHLTSEVFEQENLFLSKCVDYNAYKKNGKEKKRATQSATLPSCSPRRGLGTVINLPGEPPAYRGLEDPGSPSRSGRVAAGLPHGYGGCL